MLLQDLHTGTHCKVRVGSSHSSNVEAPWGLQQGNPITGLCSMSTLTMCCGKRWRRQRRKLEHKVKSWEYSWNTQSTANSSFWEGHVARKAAAELNLPLLLLADDLVAMASAAAGLALFMQH